MYQICENNDSQKIQIKKEKIEIKNKLFSIWNITFCVIYQLFEKKAKILKIE